MSKIFIVHGQDHKLRDKVSKIVSSVGLIPYILEKDTKSGSTIIIQEILKNIKDSIGAIIIATPDEATIEGNKWDTPKLNFKARDNVLIEAGICFALLNPENIILLLDERIIIPSNLKGIRYLNIKERQLKSEIVERLKNIKNNLIK